MEGRRLYTKQRMVERRKLLFKGWWVWSRKRLVMISQGASEGVLGSFVSRWPHADSNCPPKVYEMHRDTQFLPPKLSSYNFPNPQIQKDKNCRSKSRPCTVNRGSADDVAALLQTSKSTERHSATVPTSIPPSSLRTTFYCCRYVSLASLPPLEHHPTHHVAPDRNCERQGEGRQLEQLQQQ